MYQGKLREHPWSNWSPKPGTWWVVSEILLQPTFLLYWAFSGMWISTGLWLHHHKHSLIILLELEEDCEGDHLWRKKKKPIIWSMNRTIHVQKTSWTYFISSSKSITPKAILLFLEFIVIKLWNMGIQVYNVPVKLLLSTIYSTFFIRKYVLQNVCEVREGQRHSVSSCWRPVITNNTRINLKTFGLRGWGIALMAFKWVGPHLHCFTEDKILKLLSCSL